MSRSSGSEKLIHPGAQRALAVEELEDLARRGADAEGLGLHARLLRRHGR